MARKHPKKKPTKNTRKKQDNTSFHYVHDGDTAPIAISDSKRRWLRLVGAPGYITTGISWLCVAGAMAYWLLSVILSDPAVPDDHTVQPLPEDLQQSSFIDSLGGVAGDVARVLNTAVMVVLFCVLAGALLYILWRLTREAAYRINQLTSWAGGDQSRQYVYKIWLSILGWLLLTLLGVTAASTLESIDILILGSIIAIAVSSVSITAEFLLAKSWRVSPAHLTDLWR